jgi:hypothetical protein
MWSSIRDPEQGVPTQHNTSHYITAPQLRFGCAFHEVIAVRKVLWTNYPNPIGNHTTHRVQMKFQMIGMEFGKRADASPTSVK